MMMMEIAGIRANGTGVISGTGRKVRNGRNVNRHEMLESGHYGRLVRLGKLAHLDRCCCSVVGIIELVQGWTSLFKTEAKITIVNLVSPS